MQSSQQLALDFDVPQQPSAAPGSLDADGLVRSCLSEAMTVSGKPRGEIASRMSVLTGRRITVHMLNSWTAPGRRPWQFPLSLAVAFELAADTYQVTELHNGLRGCRTLIGNDVLMAEWGKLQRMEEEIKRAKKELKVRLGATA